MDEKLLISLGLSQNQARTYRILVLRKSLRPAQLMKLTGESRTNCYALLDKLVELGLASKHDENKKFIYYPSSPLALKKILDAKREETERQLQALDAKLPQMLTEFHTGGEQPKVQFFKGKQELADMYTKQMEEPGRELHFIRSKGDIPYFGFKKMREIRYLAPQYKKRRFGITPIITSQPTDPAKDARTGGLKRAWITGDQYTAGVEWAVSGNTVQAISFTGEGYGISITHPEIADSFKQIMQLLFDNIRENPAYAKLPKATSPKSP